MGLMVTLDNGYSRVWSTISSFLYFVDNRIDTDKHMALGNTVTRLDYRNRDTKISWTEKDLKKRNITTVDTLYEWLITNSDDWN